MEVHFAPETEARLAVSAAQQGRTPDDLAQEIIARYFEDERRFNDAVEFGEAAVRCGEFLTHEQVGQRLARLL